MISVTRRACLFGNANPRQSTLHSVVWRGVEQLGSRHKVFAEAASGRFREASVEVIETSGVCWETVGRGRRT
jgi:hypothetical protein